MLKPNSPLIDDEEGAAVPPRLPMVVDAHVHVFPHEIFAAVSNWFDEHAWRMRYELKTSELFEFLLSHVVALQWVLNKSACAFFNLDI